MCDWDTRHTWYFLPGHEFHLAIVEDEIVGFGLYFGFRGQLLPQPMYEPFPSLQDAKEAGEEWWAQHRDEWTPVFNSLQK